MDNCIFCTIASGVIEVPTVFENDQLIAFIDLHPLNPGHTLVIPKTHYETFMDMPTDEFRSFMEIAHTIAKKVNTAYPSHRLGMVVKGFDVAHAHLHLFPQLTAMDIMSPHSPDLPPQASTEERQAMADRIKSA